MTILEALEHSDLIRHENVYDGMWFDLKKMKTPMISYKFIISDKWEAKDFKKPTVKRKKKKTKQDYMNSK